MKPIGGYFSLELSQRQSPTWLSDAAEVNSSRHALEYILMSLNKKPKLIYVPYYTCEVVLEPLKRLGINYQFYHINERLEVDSFPPLEEDELIIVNNYFGVKDEYVNNVLMHYGDNVIIDNAQAFYHIVNGRNRAIYSPRKFFGVSDGGYAVTPDSLNIELPQDYSTDRFSHLLRRLDMGAEVGYADFQKNDSSISGEPLKSMSNLTRHILSSIDYERIKSIRKKNFEILHRQLAESNRLKIPAQNTFECPMIYPYLTKDTKMRQKLIDNKIFVATYWPNVFQWCIKDSYEYELGKNLIPLPIDQRYGEEEINRVIKIVQY